MYPDNRYWSQRKSSLKQTGWKPYGHSSFSAVQYWPQANDGENGRKAVRAFNCGLSQKMIRTNKQTKKKNNLGNKVLHFGCTVSLYCNSKRNFIKISFKPKDYSSGNCKSFKFIDKSLFQKRSTNNP